MARMGKGDTQLANQVLDGGNPTYIPKFEAVDANGVSRADLPAGTDRSGSVTTGGAAQTVAAANSARKGFTFQNTSDTVMSVTENGVTATATNGYLVAASGGTFRASTNRAISMFCATTGKTFAATEW